MSYSWIFVGLAIVSEITAALALRFSAGFTKPLQTLLALSTFGLAFYLISLALVSLPVSTVYPVWAGGGTAGVAIISILWLKERADIWKGIGITLVVCGIVALNMQS